MSEDNENKSLYVGNLHPECTEAVLFEKFSAVGPILSVRICRDITTSNSLGYGYVNYTTPEDARSALNTLNSDQLNGQPLRIMWAQKDVKSKLLRSANLVIKNLPKNIDDKSLRDAFAGHGTILAVKIVTHQNGNSKGYGFVQFETEKSAEDAISALNNKILQGKTLSVSKFIPFAERKKFQEVSLSNNVFVKNLTSSVTSDELEELCLCFGNIKSARIVTNGDNKSKGYGFVNFENSEDVTRAIEQLNRIYLNGRRLFASVAKEKFSKGLQEN